MAFTVQQQSALNGMMNRLEEARYVPIDNLYDMISQVREDFYELMKILTMEQ